MTALSLAMVLAEAARRHFDTVAVVDGDVRVTYAELWLEARAYAAGLRELGVASGDTVALLAPNVVDFPRVYYGVLAAGAVLVPVHLLMTVDEIGYVLRDSGARLLVCHTSQLATGRTAAAVAGIPVVTVGPVATGADTPRLEDLGGSSTPLPSYLTRSAEDTAVVLYTSGTTGAPKGALLTHLNLVMNATVNVVDANDARRTDVVLGCLPLFHSFGQTVAMNGTFRVGATLVLLSRFTGPAAIDLMVREGVNVFHGVPTMYVALLDAARDRDTLPRLRLCISGGASLPVAVLERFNAAFDTTIFEGYGLSETSPTATTNQPAFGTRAGTVGHPVWGVEVEIARAEVDDRIELLPTGELGEIVIRGHNVFAGYLGQPEATAQALVDGWFRSGDLGRKDADGFVTIVDRKKDVIIRGGFNVYPREVEEALARHPAVGQVAVIGLPDPVHGEEVCAVVVPDQAVESPPGEQELIDWSREHLGRHKYPRQVRYVDRLPLGPSLKVRKRELREEMARPSVD
ncbi:long-chain-fatty-acid--CoA ligase [Micromonospora sagamiensis]|uniref:Long-chain acyl-CoA synthetase n=1 Tax=Micromonospora sagamiensis TaxID=47875 RepID=A0A562WGX6_9ACTN|nr:long-chain fatty acid--CoA ligase [Micromonospora sagamiensis]TWJ29569.1 long-chain acyl-CoA synthetase [Micromonospora sagamiensis]BCL17402.1 AMP-dependent synthetase [Micromonospora sagamiensis]